MGRAGKAFVGVVGCAIIVVAFAPATAGASAPATLHDPANCTSLEPAPGFEVFRCDDGVPGTGGTSPNEGGTSAVTVPAVYGGYRGLPKRDADASEAPGADSKGTVALDVDVTLPSRRAPKRGFPVVFMMHGCCAGSKTGWQADEFDAPGERWHYNDSWFASRGYAVVTYTARGFVDGSGNGSTGETELDSRSFEINDFQSLACQVQRSAKRGRFDDVTGKRVRIDPKRVVATGGSYGGGFSWLALTDPKWRCSKELGSGRARMKLAAVAPKYGWTDLAQSLVPTGFHSQDPGELPDFAGCDSSPFDMNGDACAGSPPLGHVKRTIVGALYASGETGVPPGSSHTTFPDKIDEAITCLQGVYPPPASDPGCQNAIQNTLPEFLRERSAYYQSRYFKKIKSKKGWRVPIWNAATYTDPLFPPAEHVRMINRIQSVVPRYPVQTYQGDYQHFVQNKAKEWGDVCETGADRHVCTSAEFTKGFNKPAPNRVSIGATSRLNDFVDHYVRPQSNRRERRPKFDVTAALQVCPENAGDRPLDEPGPRIRAKSLQALTPGSLDLELPGTQTTTSTVLPNQHGIDADPVLNLASNGGRCPVSSEPAGPGVATYTSAPLDDRATVLGPTVIDVDLVLTPSTATGAQLNARLYDVTPEGDAVMFDRGNRVLTAEEVANGHVTFETHGNGWRLEPGHQVRIELAQDDETFVHRTDSPAGLSSMSLSNLQIELPIHERR